jgi:hypothetical protein
MTTLVKAVAPWTKAWINRIKISDANAVSLRIFPMSHFRFESLDLCHSASMRLKDNYFSAAPNGYAQPSGGFYAVSTHDRPISILSFLNCEHKGESAPDQSVKKVVKLFRRTRQGSGWAGPHLMGAQDETEKELINLHMRRRLVGLKI